MPRSPLSRPNRPRDAGGLVLPPQSPHRWARLPVVSFRCSQGELIPLLFQKSCSADFSWLFAAPQAVPLRGLLMGRGGSASRDLLTMSASLLRPSPEGSQDLVLCTGQREASPQLGSYRQGELQQKGRWSRGGCVLSLPLRFFRRSVVVPSCLGDRPFAAFFHGSDEQRLG